MSLFCSDLFDGWSYLLKSLWSTNDTKSRGSLNFSMYHNQRFVKMKILRPVPRNYKLRDFTCFSYSVLWATFNYMEGEIKMYFTSKSVMDFYKINCKALEVICDFLTVLHSSSQSLVCEEKYSLLYIFIYPFPYICYFYFFMF